MKTYLTLDIGGTFIKYGIYNNEGIGELIDSQETKENPEEFLEQIINIIKSVEEKEKFNGVAISIAGFINVKTGENLDFTIGENFTKYNLKIELKKATGYEIAIENDANCALLAEKWIGNGVNTNDFAVITFGTGIGGAIMVNGQMLRGKNFAAGEFGILNLGKEDDGSLKYAKGTSGLVSRVSKKINKKIDGKFIFENLEDKDVNEVYKEWLWEAAALVSNIAIVLDCEKILLGGGISVQDKFIEDLKCEMYKMYFHLETALEIEKCKLVNNAGMIGALYNYLKEYKEI